MIRREIGWSKKANLLYEILKKFNTQIGVMSNVVINTGTAPTVVLTSNAIPSQEGAFTLTITFDQEVSGFTIDDITETFCILSNFSTGDNITFTCTVTPQGVSENITLDVLAGVCVGVVGGIQNEASNTLNLSQWNPVANIGAAIDMELNFRHTLGKTLSGLDNSELGNTTAEGAGAVAWTSVVSGGQTVKFSGDWSYAQGLQGLESVDKTGRRYLHDGTPWEMWARVFLCKDNTAYVVHIFQNNNGTSAKRGITALLNVSAGNVVTMTFNVTDGSSVVINQAAVAMVALLPDGGSWYTIRITKTGTGTAIGSGTYTIYLDGVSKFSGTNTGDITGTGDSSDNLTIYRTSATAFTYSSRCLIKDLILINNAALSAGQVTSMTNYLALGREVIGGGPNTRYLFMLAGQSLINGSTPSSNPPVYLQGPLGAYIFVPTYGTTYAIDKKFETLDYGVNQSYDSLTHYGPNLSLGYEANLLLPGKVFIAQVARGGIPWYNVVGTDTTWSTANPSGLARNSVQFQWIQAALRIHRYQLNSTLLLFLYINEGQTDCLAANPDAVGATQPDKNAAVQASVKLNCTNFLKKVMDDFQAAGIPTSNLVIQIARMVSSFNPSTPNYTAFVNAAIDDIVANFATDNPSYVGDYQAIISQNTDYMNISADGTHPDDASQVEQGETVNTLFQPYY